MTVVEPTTSARATPLRCRVITRAQACSMLLAPMLERRGRNEALARWCAALRHHGQWRLPTWRIPLGCVDSCTTVDDLAVLVRQCSIPGIVDGLVTLRRCLPGSQPHPLAQVEALAGFYAAVDRLGPRLNHHVLCDALLESGHWLAEPLAPWLHRPAGSPRTAWRRVLALPTGLDRQRRQLERR